MSMKSPARARKSKPQSTYERIRRDIERNILSGKWSPGTKIPFEHELMQQYGCSRMTVNKAMVSLVDNGLITRRRRAGSFVAEPVLQNPIMEIHDFAREPAAADYHYKLLSRKPGRLTAAQARSMGLPANRAAVLNTECLHSVGGRPLALERRSIFLDAVAAAAAQSFEHVPPGTWLLQHVAWTDAEHTISASAADTALAQLLQLETGKPCLVLERKTWRAGEIITCVCLIYPADRYKFHGHFTPGN